MNGDVSVPGGLTAGGPGAGASARRARCAANRSTSASRASSSGRSRPPTRHSRAVTSRGVVVPELNDPRYGVVRGEDARRVPGVGRRGAVVGAQPGRRRREPPADRRPLRGGLPGGARAAGADDPRRLPFAPGLLRAARPRRDRAVDARAARCRTRRRIRSRRTSCAAVVDVLERWLAEPELVRQTSSDERPRADRGAHPPARADRARRRGALPRLRRGRLDLPLPRAARARLPARRRCTSTHGLRGAESDDDARFCAEVLGAEVVPAPGAGLSRPSCASSATPQAPAGSARPATPRATRSRRSSTGSSRAGTTTGIKPRREDGVVRPLLPLWREETEAFCRERGVEYRGRLVERRHDARADPRRDPAAARADPSGRPREHPALARDAADDAAGARRAARHAGRRRAGSTSAAGSRRCASTTASGSSAARSSCAERSTGAVGSSVPSSQALWFAGGDPVTTSPGARRRSRTCSSTPRSRAPTVKAGRSWSAAARWSRCPGSSRPTV